MARQPRSRTRARTVRPHLRLVPIDALRSHEGLDPQLLAALREAIAREGAIHEPILVEESHLVILNGHHRYAALKDLGCVRVPAYVVDYFDPRIQLRLWPTASVDHVTKKEVIARGVHGDLFPPKTTRHIVRFELRDVTVSLDALKVASRVRARPRSERARASAGKRPGRRHSRPRRSPRQRGARP